MMVPVLFVTLSASFIHIPDLKDIILFPNGSLAKEYYLLGSQHITWLEDRFNPYQNEERYLSEYKFKQDVKLYNIWLREAQWCYDAWDTLDNVHRRLKYIKENPNLDATTKKYNLVYALKEFTKLYYHLGEERFCRGWMPPPVPWWRFEERKVSEQASLTVMPKARDP